MILTAAQLRDCCQCSLVRAAAWLPHINETLRVYQVSTPVRVAAFLAQISHESARLLHASEIWGPTPAQVRYEVRTDLGNTQPGDGSRYRGRGLIQTTGRANYRATTAGLRQHGAPDFEVQPVMLSNPRWAALSAGWYWHSRGLNALADAGQFDAITKKINGGNNGEADRRELHRLARRTLGV